MAGFKNNMIYAIEFIPEAAADYKILDGGVRKKVNKKMEELSKKAKKPKKITKTLSLCQWTSKNMLKKE